MRTRLRNAAGIFLIIFGLIMCPFPVVPGIPIVAAGVAILGTNHPLVRRFRVWLAKWGIGHVAAENESGNQPAAPSGQKASDTI